MPTKVIFETTPDHLGVLWRDIERDVYHADKFAFERPLRLI
jgi:hypothetical protein